MAANTYYQVQRGYPDNGYAQNAEYGDPSQSQTGYAAPAYQGQNGQYPAPEQQAQAPENQGQPAISTKIAKINGNKRVIDFVARLIPAKREDFAMVHGCGGSGHAPNSTVRLTICDYSRGTGNSSVTVSYSLDVEMVPVLYQAALEARLGHLSQDAKAPATTVSTLNALLAQMRTWTAYPPNQGGYFIPQNEIISAGQQLASLVEQLPKGTAEPGFSYAKSKNNPYAKKPDGFVPVSSLTINYQPIRNDGAKSNYPWYIAIENCEAPLVEKASGAMPHNAAKARNKRSAYIMISEDDFCMALAAVERHIRLFEQAYMPIFKAGYRSVTEAAKAKQATSMG